MLRFLRPARALPLVIAVLLAAPAAASAWQVTVQVHGAGRVTENTPRNLMDCTVAPASFMPESATTNCVAGSPTGVYNHGDVVELQASVPQEYYDRGWRFQKWVDASGSGLINCDPQDATGNHLIATCKFQIFENLSVHLYFDDTFGPSGVSISGGPTGTTSASSATFGFDAVSDPDARYTCRLDKPGVAGNYFPCGNSADKSETYNSLTANGQYTFYVEARDASGNFGSVASRTWTIDNIGPTTSINGGPANGSRTTSTSASFGLSASETASFQCKLDTPSGPGAFGSCGAAPSYSSLPDGTYTFSARSTDTTGNQGPVVSRTWTVDTQPPNTSISGGGPTGTTSSNSPTFGFTSSEPNSTFECKLDGGAWEPCNSGTKGYTSLADGEHTFRVRATDATALTDPTEAVRTWTIDTVTPDTSIGSGPSGDTTSTSASFGFSATEAGTTFECKLDGGAWESCTSGKSYSGLWTGPHTFLVRATDAAGNVDQSEAVRSWTVTAPPGGTQPGGTQTGGTQPGGTQTGAGADTTKPVATITFAKQKLARVLKVGFVGSAASTEGGKLRLDVLMGRKQLLVATSNSRALGGPGSMKLTAKFTRKAKRALARLRSVKLTVRLTATDAAGNVTVTKKTLTLKR
jgi:hypothetical protein